MTENKRFKLGYVCGDFGLIDNDEWIDLHSMSENSEKNVQICINKLNALADENEQLKSELRFLRDFRGFITEKNVENEQQRKGLQLQMLRLYNYFEDYFEDTMSPENFSEMWDIVKESEKWEKR